MSVTSTKPKAGSEHSERGGPVLACVCACTALVIGLVAAVNLAVPAMAASTLNPSSSVLLWIVDAYVVVFACLVIPGGAAGDRFGRKGVLTTGLICVAAGATVCAAAPTVAIMLTGRAVTGVGAAMVLPNCVGVLVHATAPQRRTAAIAVWGTTSGLGGIVGNLAGGVLLTGGSWRRLFAFVVPVALLLALWVALGTPRSARSGRRLDPTGTLLSVVATVTLLLGIIEGPEHGWGSALVVTAFLASAVLWVCWVLLERRVDSPLLDPRLFRIPALASASVGMLVTFFGSFGLFFVNASLLQYARGYSVLQAGLGVLPVALPLALGASFVPRMAARIGMPLTLSAAFVAVSAGLFGLSATVGGSYLAYAAWLVVTGTGFALALPTLTTQITSALPPDQAGVGGGLQSATRELGSALGVAVVGTVLTSRFTAHLPAVLLAVRPVPRTVAQALEAGASRTSALHAAVVGAYVDGAGEALRMAGVVTLLAGAVVVAGSRAHRRPPRRP